MFIHALRPLVQGRRHWPRPAQHALTLHGRPCRRPLSGAWLALCLLPSPALLANSFGSSLTIKLDRAEYRDGTLAMWATLTGGSEADPIANPCHQVRDCTIRAFAVDVRWPGKIRFGVRAQHDAPLGWDNCSRESATMGAFVSCARRGGVFQFPLYGVIPINAGDRDQTEMCLFSAFQDARGLSIMTNKSGVLSNCVKGSQPVAACRFAAGEIAIRATGSAATLQGRTWSSTPTSLTCDSTMSGTLRLADAAPRIPLDGGGACELDLGGGVNLPYRITVKAGTPTQVIATCRFTDLEGPGKRRGTGMLVFSLD